MAVRSPSDYVYHGIAHRRREAEAAGEEYRCQQILEAWVTASDAKPYTGRGIKCLGKLENTRHRCQTDSGRCAGVNWLRDHRFSALDHEEWWKGPSGEFIVTAHPYLFPVNESFNPVVAENESCRELAAYCQERGLRLEIDRDGSWYWPGRTVLVVMYGRRHQVQVQAVEIGSKAKSDAVVEDEG